MTRNCPASPLSHVLIGDISCPNVSHITRYDLRSRLWRIVCRFGSGTLRNALVEPVRLLQLPSAGAADDYLRLVLQNGGVRDDAYELVRVQGHQVLAREFRVHVRGVGDAERVVRVYGDDTRLGADEFFEVLDVARDDVGLGVFAQQ